MQHLSLIHQVSDRSRDVFDGNFGIHTVLIKQIDVVCTKPLQRILDHDFYVIRFAVEPRKSPTSLLINIPTELGRDSDLVSKRLYGLPQDPLVFPRPVRLRRVEERYASV